MLHLAALLLASPALLQPGPEDVADAKCMIAMASKLEQAPEEAKASVQGVMLFYLGKLAGRHAAAEVRDIVNAVEQDTDPADLEAAGPGCANAMADVGNVLKGQ